MLLEYSLLVKHRSLNQATQSRLQVETQKTTMVKIPIIQVKIQVKSLSRIFRLARKVR